MHFFGGIHEIYFPYVLAKPKLIAALILGGATGVLTNVIFDSGLRAPAAPGSIFAVLGMTASNSYVGVILSVVLSATVTFIVAAFLLRLDKNRDLDLASSTQRMEQMKGKSSIAGSLLTGAEAGPIRSIVFACDAGMGSSAMGASVIRNKIQATGHGDITVVNKAIANLTDDFDLVVTHQDLTERARQRSGSAVHVSVETFMDAPQYDEIVALIGQRQQVPVPAGAPTATAQAPEAVEEVPKGILADEAIVLEGQATSREGAIEEAGQLLVATGAVTTGYVTSMHAREKSVSTFVGNGLAIPHGTNEAKSEVSSTAVSFVRYPSGIDWDGQRVKFVIGIAGTDNDHLALLQRVTTVFLDEAAIDRLERAATVDEVKAILEA